MSKTTATLASLLGFGMMLYVILFSPISARAQNDSSLGSEVYLNFSYRGVVNSYITAYYRDDQFYLPVSELFGLLEISHQINQGNFTVSGTYLGETPFELNFNNRYVVAGDTRLSLGDDDFIIPQMDYYMRPELFETLFGLEFTINFSNLTLDLSTTNTLPIIAQYERQQRRNQLNRDSYTSSQTLSYFPLRYDRTYSSLDGGILDYNLNLYYSNGQPLVTVNNALGMELFSGDLQGNILGVLSSQQQNLTTSGLRWRYSKRDNPDFSTAFIGQVATDGFGRRNIRGVKLTNKPIEPRRLFDRFPIDGVTVPLSEVELYMNDRLVDFQESDESGNYRFIVPLTYGSTDYTLRIFTPTGQEIERSTRIQIPFDYIPQGEVDFSLSTGQLNNRVSGLGQDAFMADGAISAGLSNWLTVQAASEYVTAFHDDLPNFTGTLNARIFSNYLLSVSANSENFYRMSSSVVYRNGSSWNLSYSYNPGKTSLYNISSSDHQGRINLYTPFTIAGIPINLRMGSSYQIAGGKSLYRYRGDLNTRFGRLNVRVGFQDQQSGTPLLKATPSARLLHSFTYSMGRDRSLPIYLRGLILRGQLSYLPGLQSMEEIQFQTSRNIFETGSMQLSFRRNFLGEFNSINLNFSIDFSNFRSNTSANVNRNEYSVTQGFRGSFGFDSNEKQLFANNRQQVGQAGAAIRLYIDHDNDGEYTADQDEVINDPAVRLNRSGGQIKLVDGINYITQLQPYYRYNIEINQGALSNPLLVPEFQNFSIVTDPNQYKPINIPFYLSGVISGRVEQMLLQGADTTMAPASGVRVYLESDYDSTVTRSPLLQEIRTFSDGSFYTYEIPPGDYKMYIDQQQLNFLQGVSQPDTLRLEVESLAQGDFVENLQFTIIPISALPDSSRENGMLPVPEGGNMPENRRR